LEPGYIVTQVAAIDQFAQLFQKNLSVIRVDFIKAISGAGMQAENCLNYL
jgi:hypothetical protein